MIVIEHDMPLVRSISDEIMALDLGPGRRPRDTPDVVLHDPRVVASYLGTNDAAVARSGTGGLLRARPERAPGWTRVGAAAGARATTWSSAW